MAKVIVPLMLAALGLLACAEAPTASTPSSVQYAVTSPFCGPITFTIQFSVDGVVIGSEQLKHGQTSKLYDVSPGRHTLGARIVNWSLTMDTTLTLVSGRSFTRELDLYCS